MKTRNIKRKVRVGTRGSHLAVTQTELIINMLKSNYPDIDFEIVKIKTSGDEGKLEVVGAFVKEVELELKSNNIDMAVHSLKDMPTVLPEGVAIRSIPVRGDIRDCLISKDSLKLNELPRGANVGTSSFRRAYQLKLLRPDLCIVPLHGNILTRINKVEKGELDAIVLAAAGIQRVNLSGKIAQHFSTKEMLPAVAQGALAIEVRVDDEELIEIVKVINDNDTVLSVEAERAFLMALGGGCRMPIAASAQVIEFRLELKGLMFSEDGSMFHRGEVSGKPLDAAILGKNLAEDLLARFQVK